MKRFLVPAILCIFSVQMHAQTYQPLLAEKWNLVAQNALQNWASQRSTSPDLPHPFITAWADRNYMFYWDSYFINEGLLLTPLDSFARNNVLNLLHAVDRFGYVGNAVVTPWGMNRSQPPYLSAMVRSYYEQKGKGDTAFLRRAYNTLKKEYAFWTDQPPYAIENHSTPVAGLQRYSQHATDKELLELYRHISQRFHYPTDIPDTQKIRLAIPFAVEAGAGMDFTPRFEDRSPDFVSVDLNAFLYNYERNFAWMEKTLGMGNGSDWEKKATERKKLLNKYCWDEKRGLFMDYDFVNKRFSKVAAYTAFQPMWAGLATKEQASRMVKNLPLLETDWGLVVTEKYGGTKRYQWGEISVWPPVQLMMVQALDRYGYKAEAKRIATKYLDLVTKNFLEPKPAKGVRGDKEIQRVAGKTFEKYTPDGRINDDEYLGKEMMGWTTGVFIWMMNYLKSL